MIAKLQAIFYILGGLWPVIHMQSFEFITGPKVDKWLVKSFGWLMAAIGLQLWAADMKQVALLGISSAIVIGGADSYYSLKGRISKVYLLDAVVQLLFIIGWLFYFAS